MLHWHWQLTNSTCSPVLSDNIDKVDVALFSNVLVTQLNKGRVLHACTRWSRANCHGNTGAGHRARARLLLFLLEYVAQRALTCPHWIIQCGAQEAIGRPEAVTGNELETDDKENKDTKTWA